MRPELCVGAVARRREEVLLVRRAREPGRGRWSLPGGRIEGGETIREAVAREVREETGLEVVVGSLLGWVERIGDDHHYVILDFEVTVLSDDAPTPGDDAAEARWVSVESITEYDLVDGLIEFLADAGVVRTLT